MGIDVTGTVDGLALQRRYVFLSPKEGVVYQVVLESAADQWTEAAPTLEAILQGLQVAGE